MNQIARPSRFWQKNLFFLLALLVAVLVTWKIIQQANHNWQLDQQAAEIRARINLLEQQKKNQALENEFFRSEYYVHLAIREQQGYLLADEIVLVINSDKIERLKNEYQTPFIEEEEEESETHSNLQQWWHFVFGSSEDESE